MGCSKVHGCVVDVGGGGKSQGKSHHLPLEGRGEDCVCARAHECVSVHACMCACLCVRGRGMNSSQTSLIANNSGCGDPLTCGPCRHLTQSSAGKGSAGQHIWGQHSQLGSTYGGSTGIGSCSTWQCRCAQYMTVP